MGATLLDGINGPRLSRERRERPQKMSLQGLVLVHTILASSTEPRRTWIDHVLISFASIVALLMLMLLDGIAGGWFLEEVSGGGAEGGTIVRDGVWAFMG